MLSKRLILSFFVAEVHTFGVLQYFLIIDKFFYLPTRVELVTIFKEFYFPHITNFLSSFYTCSFPLGLPFKEKCNQIKYKGGKYTDYTNTTFPMYLKMYIHVTLEVMR